MPGTNGVEFGKVRLMLVGLRLIGLS